MSIKWSFVKISSLRNPREHGTSLFPIFNAPNRTSKKKKKVVYFCQNVHHSTLRLKGLLTTPSVNPSNRICRHCPRILQGLSPGLSCYFHFALLYPLQQVPHFSFCPEALCLLSVRVFLQIISWPSRNLKWDNLMSQRPEEPSLQTVWKFTWSRWTTRWIEKPDSHGSDLWVPSLSALMTRRLSAETESLGFPIHLSPHMSSASDKGIITSLINCESVLFKFVWTASGKSDDVCFHSHCQILWHTKMTPREHCCHSTIRCTNQTMMSLLFAHLWSGTGPQLQLPVDPPETHTYNQKKEASLNMWGSEEEASVKSDKKSKAMTKSLSQRVRLGQRRREKIQPQRGWAVEELGAKWRYFTMGTPCDLLLCLVFLWGLQKWLWDSVFLDQEASPAFLGGLLFHSGGGPPQICPPADPELRSTVVSTTLSCIY